MIAGMRDYMGGKLGRFVRKQLSHLSPIDLAESEARQKLRTSFGRNVPSRSWRQDAVLETGEGFWGGTQSMFEYGSQQASKVKGNYTLGDYFTGKNFSDMMEGSSGWRTGDQLKQLQRRRMMSRIGIPGIIGGGAALDMTIGENPISNVGRSALSGGMTLGVGAGMSRFGGKAGTVGAAALFGYSTINALRGGDQIGPF